MVQIIATKEEFHNILKTNKLVAVDFTASWCGPCKRIGPVFESLVDNYKNIKFVKVDVDENRETSEEQIINAMPTFKFFANGKEAVEALVGASEKELKEKLAQLNGL